MEILSTSEEETIGHAAEFVRKVKPKDIIFLRGTLGAGKSVFARALIRTLTNAPNLDVPSPTFTLVQSYDSPKGELWHLDLYRLKHPEEIYELGWEEAVGEHILLVEWPERLGALAPSIYTDIHITHDEVNTHYRNLNITQIGKP